LSSGSVMLRTAAVSLPWPASQATAGAFGRTSLTHGSLGLTEFALAASRILFARSYRAVSFPAYGRSPQPVGVGFRPSRTSCRSGTCDSKTCLATRGVAPASRLLGGRTTRRRRSLGVLCGGDAVG